MISKMYLLTLRFARLVEFWYLKGAGITVLVIRFIDLLQEVLGNTGTGVFAFREQGILSNYFEGTRELLITLLGSREH